MNRPLKSGQFQVLIGAGFEEFRRSMALIKVEIRI
tara:strand:- start:37626 stop:37730 length:105 start_codon:yes stop_codon:yes gene_type:complete